MTYFIKKDERTVISVSFKGMYSSMKKQKEFYPVDKIALNKNNLSYFWAWSFLVPVERFIKNERKNYLLARHPLSRFESLYKDVQRRAGTAGDYLPLNDATMLFTHLIHHSQKTPVLRITPDQVASFSLESAVRAMKELFAKNKWLKDFFLTRENHTKKQTQLLYCESRSLPFPFNRYRIAGVLKMENPEDMAFLRSLGVDTDIQENKSSNAEKNNWTGEMRDTMYELYQDDFDYLDYDPHDAQFQGHL